MLPRKGRDMPPSAALPPFLTRTSLISCVNLTVSDIILILPPEYSYIPYRLVLVPSQYQCPFDLHYPQLVPDRIYEDVGRTGTHAKNNSPQVLICQRDWPT